MPLLKVREPYTEDELKVLYPDDLELSFVQIFLRHGERTPVAPRFQNAGLTPHWPYCSAANKLYTALISKNPETGVLNLGAISWRRRLETFSAQLDEPAMTQGPGGSYDGICEPGELTDSGRKTTLALGERLRHLYIDQLGFMPKTLPDADSIYIRTTHVPRALESVQEAFTGFYPQQFRERGFPPITIITRSSAEETLYPNEPACQRLVDLSRQFAQRTANRWNDTSEMAHLSHMLGQYMPEQQPVAVDSHPRLSGILDTINSTLAHGPQTRLPRPFYDAKVRDIAEHICVEEWFSGFKESEEYRRLGIGGAMSDVVARMVGKAQHERTFGIQETGGQGTDHSRGRAGEMSIRFALNACHDTTLAAMLSSLGAFNTSAWPPFTSHIAYELFYKPQNGRPPRTSWSSRTWAALTGAWPQEGSFNHIGKKPLSELRNSQKQELDNYYVRIRYNDDVMKVPGCKADGKHLPGDDSFCTLAAFKEIVDKYTPKNWQSECRMNLGKSAFPTTSQPAGF